MDAPTARIDRLIAPRAPSQAPTRIPLILHQTFETVDIPQRMFDAAMSWVHKNPAFEYRFSDAEARKTLIETHFGADVVAAYDKLTYGAFKADLWRYCALSVTGGVYADVDTLCRTDLRTVIRPEDTFIVPNTGNVPHAVFNAFICVAPGHPFMTAAVERATEAIHASDAEDFDGYMATGPGNLGAAMNMVLGRGPRAVHAPGIHRHDGQTYRIIEKKQGADGSRHVADGDVVVFLTKYEGYLDDLGDAGVDHWADHVATPNLMRRLKRLLKRLLGRG